MLRRLLQRLLPALAGGDAAFGVEIEEDVVPAVLQKPIAELDGPVVIGARMTDENARHGRPPGGRTVYEYASQDLGACQYASDPPCQPSPGNNHCRLATCPVWVISGH